MASGDTLWVFIPEQHDIPLATTPAVPGYITGVAGFRPSLRFDDTVDESVIWTFIMPSNYAGGGITLRFFYAMESATSGAVGIEAAIERVADAADLDAAGSDFAAANGASETVPTTAHELSSSLTVAFTDGADMDSLAANELGRLKVNRDADGTTQTDTATGDAHLLAIVMTET
jgi:hypothetical protein